MYGPITLTLSGARLTHFCGLISQGSFAGYAGQSFQVTAVGGVADLTPPPKVGDATAQFLPAKWPLGVCFAGAIHLELFGPHNGGFYSQHAALLVIHLDRVAIDRMAQPHPFG